MKEPSFRDIRAQRPEEKVIRLWDTSLQKHKWVDLPHDAWSDAYFHYNLISAVFKMLLQNSLFVVISTLAYQIIAGCAAPDPVRRICYNSQGSTPQNVSTKDIESIAVYLRQYISIPWNPKFYTMRVKDADNCGEWEVYSQGSATVLAKLVGNRDASVLFSDIASTLDGTNATSLMRSLLGCFTAGGQMGTWVSTANPLYKSPEFVNGGFTNEGIIIKVVASRKGP